jgi:hypothetical protein
MRRFRILAGLVVTVVGVVWLVSRLGGVGDALPVLGRWWPVAAVALGVLNLLALVRRPAWLLAPLLLIAGGGVGLLLAVGPELPGDTQPYVWPVVVSTLGVVVALWERERIQSDDEFVRQTVVLQSRRFHSTTRNYLHGVVRAFVGNLELDLQRCELQNDAELCVTTFLGHVDLLPPPDCQVRLKRPHGWGVAVPELAPLDPEEVKTKDRVLEVSVLGFVGGFDLRPVWDREAAVAVDGARHQASRSRKVSAMAGRRS